MFQFSFGQRKIVEEATIPMFTFTYSYHIPSGDLADRFGNSSMIGSGFSIKTNKGWIFGADAGFIFGNNVKEDGILDGIRTSNGNIINLYGEYATVLLSERGYYLGLSLGKVIPIFKVNSNSGVLIKGGIGFIEHKINIENQSNNAPQVLDDYKKGYDRLTNGLSSNAFLGYLFIGENQLSNFYAGIEVYQSWTANRRDYNFDTMIFDETERKDNLIGFKVGWIIPLYRRIPDNYFTY